MKYNPFRDLILVKKIEEKQTVGGIVLPDNKRSRFIKLEILAVGPDVKLNLNQSDIVYAENMYQALDKEQGLILEQYVFAKENQ